FRQGGIAGDHSAAITIGAEILGGIEAEGAGVPQGADQAPTIPGAVSLGAVLEQEQVVTFRQGGERAHVGWVSVEMNGNQDTSARRDGCPGCVWIHGVSDRVDVDQYGTASGSFDGADRGHGRMGNRDDLVAGADTRSPQSQLDGVSSSGDAHGV